MSPFLKFFVLSGLCFIRCGKADNIAPGTPNCVTAEINRIKSNPKWNPAARVFSYQYKGQTVYYIPPRCCDVASTLLDANCTILCAPDGGISGGGDGKCADFFKVRSAEKLIWQDPR